MRGPKMNYNISFFWLFLYILLILYVDNIVFHIQSVTSNHSNHAAAYCSVSVPTEVNLDQINKNSMPSVGLVESKSFDTVFSNCKDKTLQMGVQATDIRADGSWAYFHSGDPDGTFFYNIQLPHDSEITGGRNLGDFDVFYLNNVRPVYIQPGSDNYTMSSKVNFYRIANASLANVGSALSASFTYNISYQ
ncbi:hypothetical protein DB963_22720 [Salmonella enterica]|nr:hypothetical protein [Salmonella enterica]